MCSPADQRVEVLLGDSEVDIDPVYYVHGEIAQDVLCHLYVYVALAINMIRLRYA